jgi:hypothetical protein
VGDLQSDLKRETGRSASSHLTLFIMNLYGILFVGAALVGVSLATMRQVQRTPRLRRDDLSLGSYDLRRLLH